MNRRAAKREAYGRAADCLFDALNAGWDELEQTYGEDAEKVRAGINEIRAELQRRGAPTRTTDQPNATPTGDTP